MLNILVVVVAVVITLLVVVVVVAVILVAVAARTRFCKQTNIKTAATNKTQTRVASASIVRPGGGAASLLFAIPPYPASPLPTAANPRTTTTLCIGAARLRGGRGSAPSCRQQLPSSSSSSSCSVQVRSIFNKTIKFRWNRRRSSKRKSRRRQRSRCIRSKKRRRGQRWRGRRRRSTAAAAERFLQCV